MPAAGYHLNFIPTTTWFKTAVTYNLRTADYPAALANDPQLTVHLSLYMRPTCRFLLRPLWQPPSLLVLLFG